MIKEVFCFVLLINYSVHHHWIDDNFLCWLVTISLSVVKKINGKKIHFLFTFQNMKQQQQQQQYRHHPCDILWIEPNQIKKKDVITFRYDFFFWNYQTIQFELSYYSDTTGLMTISVFFFWSKTINVVISSVCVCVC